MPDDQDLPSVRLLGHEIRQPVTGLPSHIRIHLDRQIAACLDSLPSVLLDKYALQLGLSRSYAEQYGRVYSFGDSMVDAVRSAGEGVYLDLIQKILQDVADDQTHRGFASSIDWTFAMGGSAYGVSPDRQRLIHRNDPIVTAAAVDAVSVEDEAGAELASAWNHAFGLSPDAGAAWGDAIRAVEALLIPVLWPNTARRGKQTVTSARDRLRNEQGRWATIHPKITLQLVIDMLSSLAYEPGRHGADPAPAPTLDESRAAVHLALTLVSWLRSGLITGVGTV